MKRTRHLGSDASSVWSLDAGPAQKNVWIFEDEKNLTFCISGELRCDDTGVMEHCNEMLGELHKDTVRHSRAGGTLIIKSSARNVLVS